MFYQSIHNIKKSIKNNNPMPSCKTKGYIIAATKKRKKEEDRVRRGILAMNGTCAQNNAPKASTDKRNRSKKKHEKKKIKTSEEDVLKTEKEKDSGEEETFACGDDNNSSSPPPKKKKKEDENNIESADLQLALDDISKQTRQVAPSSSLSIAPPCVIRRKHTNNKKIPPTLCSNRREVSLPLESLRSATLRLQYPLKSSVLKRKKKLCDSGQPRLITTSIDIIRCLLAESNWALMRRKNPAESFKFWFTTHDNLSSLLNNNDYVSANRVLVQLNKVSIGYGLRENNYFELLGDACNSLFGTALLHNKMFDPDLVSVNQHRLIGEKNTKAKTVIKSVYYPIWAKMSETLNMITCGTALIGGKGDMFALQRCADNVLNKLKNDRLGKIIKEVTARTNQMAKFGVALKPSTAKQQQRQQQQPLLFPYPPPMFYTHGDRVGFNNNNAEHAAFASLPQFTPGASSTATTTAAPPQPNLQTQSGNTPPLPLPATTTTSTAASASSQSAHAPPPPLPVTTTTSTAASSSPPPPPTTTTSHLSTPVLFPSYVEEEPTTTTPPRFYPPAPEALQRNMTLQTIFLSDHEEEEEEESEFISKDEEVSEFFLDDEQWRSDI
uniref:Wsv161-like protein n=1 Tax=Hemigrapsus takanoi nimavirus TaxID=2133792 RepID=A0A401IP48_9VIRU|nr:MAG: wsv161-like protein [Hemigrapsus takanoi nimavirus]GBG35385.1 wsv161-like protein [Hemigrapsus takanoi nimavirus]